MGHQYTIKYLVASVFKTCKANIVKTENPIDYTIIFIRWVISWRLWVEYLSYAPFMHISKGGYGSEGR